MNDKIQVGKTTDKVLDAIVALKQKEDTSPDGDKEINLLAIVKKLSRNRGRASSKK